MGDMTDALPGLPQPAEEPATLADPAFDPLREVAMDIVRQAEHICSQKFGAQIRVISVAVTRPDGRPDTAFDWRWVKPGLLRTPRELAYFEGLITGYRQACNLFAIALDMPDDARPS